MKRLFFVFFYKHYKSQRFKALESYKDDIKRIRSDES